MSHMNRRTSEKNMAKAARNRRIYGYSLVHPEATLREMAQMFGLSFQRIHQIIQREAGNGKYS